MQNDNDISKEQGKGIASGAERPKKSSYGDKKRTLAVKHEPSMKFVKTTSLNGNPKDTKVTFKEAGGYHKKMMEGLASPGYQAHRAAKDRQRGIH